MWRTCDEFSHKVGLVGAVHTESQIPVASYTELASILFF